MLKMRQIELKIFQKCVNYFKNPVHDKKRRTCPRIPTGGTLTYWTAPATYLAVKWIMSISRYILGLFFAQDAWIELFLFAVYQAV